MGYAPVRQAWRVELGAGGALKGDDQFDAGRIEAAIQAFDSAFACDSVRALNARLAHASDTRQRGRAVAPPPPPDA
jgi:hypothetical protein